MDDDLMKRLRTWESNLDFPAFDALNPDDMLVLVGPPDPPTDAEIVTPLGMLGSVVTRSTREHPAEVTITAPIVKDMDPLIDRLAAARRRVGRGGEQTFGLGLVLRFRDHRDGVAVYVTGCDYRIDRGLNLSAGLPCCFEHVVFQGTRIVPWDFKRCLGVDAPPPAL